jgi:lipopolysaccharide biosynthesis regulator YciM
MGDFTLIAILVALLAGLAVGKTWERYKLRNGRWIDRRRLRETPHYMLGLTSLADNRIDQAIDELTQAANVSADSIEIQMILGNLYRQKGQVSRAITVHQGLLQRPGLTRMEHAYGLLCLGLDFRHAGFVDRALEAFHEVLRLDAGNRYALVNLQKLHEDQKQWKEAAAVREQITLVDGGNDPTNRRILAFLRNEAGSTMARAGDGAAAASFRQALETDEHTVPAYLNLGDIVEGEGRLVDAVELWERLIATVPDRAYLAFERLERAYETLGVPGRFVDLCSRLIAQSPQDWRVRLALSRHHAAAERHREAFELLLDALPHNPHGLVIHQAIWRALLALQLDPALARRYVALARDAVFYLDPHICIHCRYRSTELLWQCPQCHEWDSFIEERIAPAKDEPIAEALSSE